MTMFKPKSRLTQPPASGQPALPHAASERPTTLADAGLLPSASSAPDVIQSADAPIAPSLARVTTIDRSHCLIWDGQEERPARLTGRQLHQSNGATDLPCVGDWVSVQYHDGGTHASIRDILPRQSWLRRKSPGKTVAFQMIATNIDIAFIVQSCHTDFNVRRLERYLVMAADGQIQPVIMLSKTDLISPEQQAQLIGQIRRAGISAPVIALSSVSGAGIDELRTLLAPGRTCCLLGSSGVGKTTLINNLTGDGRETQTVSGSGEGRHTTTRRQLIALPGGGSLIDMPGMRELGLLEADASIDAHFADVGVYASQCRFNDCTHSGEPGCAIRQAIADGALSAEQVHHYGKLKRENELHTLSNFEKRKKDRAFGKLVHAVAAQKNKRRCGEE